MPRLLQKDSDSDSRSAAAERQLASEEDQSAMLARVGAKVAATGIQSFTRDYSSPSLGSRRLGAAKDKEKPKESSRSKPSGLASSSVDRMQVS